MTYKTNFQDITSSIEQLVSIWEVKFLQLQQEVIIERINSQERTIKQIVGHMIDSACNNHQRIVRLQYKEKLDFPDYRPDNDKWIAIQKYQQEDWNLMIKLWKFYNLHLAHLFLNIDSNCLDNSWKDSDKIDVTLREMIEGYLVHLELHLIEITELIERE